MKKTFLSFAFLSLSIAVFGQFCRNYKAVFQTIQTNGIRADLGPTGILQNLNGRSAFTPYYKDENTTPTIFQANLWFIGKSGATRKVSAGFYSDFRFSAGPIDDATRAPIFENCGKWNQYWTVRRAEIEVHQRDFADNGRIDNPIKNIMAWPAVGNPNSLTINGFELPRRTVGRSYAPFKDVDNDGIYDPMRGDFPAISTGSAPSPDLITWNVFNDVGAFQSLNFEVQTTTYGYECADTAGVFNNTLFSSYKIINHGTTDLDSFKIGVFASMDLGCIYDENVGCDSSLQTFFVYKKDSSRNVRGVGNCFQIPSFQGNIPVQALTFLNQPMSSFRTFSALNNVPPSQTDPQTVSDFFNYFNGKWKDGTPITRGGSGYNVGSTNTTNYMFPSDPFDSSATAWSMVRPFQSLGDVRTIGVADMNKIAAGETKTFDIAYSAHRRLGRNAWQNVGTMREEVAQIRQFYQNPTAAALCTRPTLCDGADCVWAGDANKDGIANYKDLLPIGVAQGQTGVARSGNVTWSPKTVANWTSTFPDGNFNAKHIDCNGDGVVTLADIATLKNNIQLTKPDFRRPNDVYTEGPNLFMTFDRDPDNLQYSNLNNYNFTGIVKVLPVTDLFGLAFEVEYDPYFLKIVQPIDGNLPTTNLISIIIDSTKLTDRKAQIECSRLGFNFQGADVAVLKFKLGVNESNFNWPTNITFLKFKNIKGIKRDGTIIPLGGQTQRVRFTDILIDNKEIENAKIAIYPNPTTDATTVEWGKIAVKNLRLSNAMGQVVLEKPMAAAAESTVLNLRELPTGIYFLQIQTIENKTAVRKVILSR